MGSHKTCSSSIFKSSPFPFPVPCLRNGLRRNGFPVVAAVAAAAVAVVGGGEK